MNKLTSGIQHGNLGNTALYGILIFNVANGASGSFNLLRHVCATLGGYADRPLRRRTDPYLAAKLRTAFGKKIGEHIIRSFARGTINYLNGKTGQRDFWIELGDCGGVPVLNVSLKNLSPI